MMQLAMLLALWCPILSGSYQYRTWWRALTHSGRTETAVSMLKSREKADRLAEIIKPLTPSVTSTASKHSTLRYVERRIPKEERIPLTSIEVGQRYDGLIINIKEFGMFIDIGTALDGFAHVSDCSQAIFVDSLQKKYSAGQEISVWVKFINIKEKKLGLQLFPPVQVPTLDKLEWEDLERGKQIKAVVTKTSQYGSYLNINGPALAFMHRRKMLSNNRQRKLQSWDLAPVGSIHKCYIYQVDLARKRIELTSFPPDVWERRFGTSIDDDMDDDLDDYDDDDEDDDDEYDLEEDDDDDNEELGGTATANNKRAVLQSLDDDWEANAELDEDETEDILSPAEVQKLTGRKLLIDELTAPATGSSSSSSANKQEELTDEELEEEADELSAEELFYELSSGRSFITLANLKNWDYIRVLLKNGDLDNEILREMFQASGGFNGRLKKADFGNFMELFELAIGEDDDDDDEDSDDMDIDEDEDGDLELDLGEFSSDDSQTEATDNSSPSYLLDDGASSDDFINTTDGEENEEDNLYEDLTEKSSAGSVTRSGKVTMSNRAGTEILDFESIAAELDNMIEEDAKAKQMTGGSAKSPTGTGNNLVDNIYQTLSRKKKTLNENDVLQWDFCRALVSQGIATDNELLEELRRIQGKAKSITRDVFGMFVEEVSQWEFRHKANRQPDSSSSVAPEEVSKPQPAVAKAETDTDGEDKAADETDNSKDSDDDDEFDPEEDHKLLTEVFQSLAKGKRSVKHRDLLEWDLVLDLLTYGVLSEEDLEQKVEQYSTGTGRSRGMDLEGFDKFVNEMMVIHSDAGIWFKDEDSEDDGEGDDEDEDEDNGNKQQIVTSSTRSLSPTRNSKPSTLTINDNEELTEDNNEEEEESNDVQGEDDEDDSIELDPEEIFTELSKDKKYVTYEALRNWDFVKSMIERKDFTDFQFENLLTNFDPKSKNKVNLEEFEVMLDEIMLLAGILREDEDGEYDDEDGDGEEEE